MQILFDSSKHKKKIESMLTLQLQKLLDQGQSKIGVANNIFLHNHNNTDNIPLSLGAN